MYAVSRTARRGSTYPFVLSARFGGASRMLWVLVATNIADLVDRTRVIESAMRQRERIDPLKPVTV